MPMDSDTCYICTGDNGTAKIVQPHERSRERRASIFLKYQFETLIHGLFTYCLQY